MQEVKRFQAVSIQLMSPASGDAKMTAQEIYDSYVSIQLMSPASGDVKEESKEVKEEVKEFPFN